MATFQEMQTYVSKRLLDPQNVAVSVEDVASAINDSIAYWKFKRFYFNEVYDTATMTAQDPAFPYPSDFLVPVTDDDGFNIQYSSMRYPLSKIDQGMYDAMFLTNGYGLPQFYARMGNGVNDYKAYPIPDRDYTVGRHYLKNYNPLVAYNETNDFTVYAPRLINLWALANLSAEFRQDDKMEAYYRSASENEYSNLCTMGDKANGTGKLVLESSLIC